MSLHEREVQAQKVTTYVHYNLITMEDHDQDILIYVWILNRSFLCHITPTITCPLYCLYARWNENCLTRVLIRAHEWDMHKSILYFKGICFTCKCTHNCKASWTKNDWHCHYSTAYAHSTPLILSLALSINPSCKQLIKSTGLKRPAVDLS